MQDRSEVLKLSAMERLKVIEELWNSLEAEDIAVYEDLSKDQDAEMQNRIDKIQAGESKLYTWDEVKAKLKRGE
jgi:putative addiction module component (TIGR02574 family)